VPSWQSVPGKNNMRILNYGSLNIDYVYDVEHFVRGEETIDSLKLEIFPGGKGLNQSIALARAGAAVSHLGMVGRDGAFLKELLDACGVGTSHISTGECITGHAIIQVDAHGQNCILLYGGANRQIPSSRIDDALKDFTSGELLLLQNETNRNKEIMEKAFAKGMAIALNPSPVNQSIFELPLETVSWLIFNEIEGEALTGETIPEKILEHLYALYPRCTTVLTLGNKGVICQNSGHFLHHGIYRQEIVDTTAAGDTFTGYFLAGISSGVSLTDALELASKASSMAVGKKGASSSIPCLAEVLAWNAVSVDK
jgi:ribokinase